MKTFERNEGKTPNGGAYSIAYFFDEEKKPCIKEKAWFIEIHEYDNNDNLIYRSYLTKRRSSSK